jgi:excisionase family DNA binding protein
MEDTYWIAEDVAKLLRVNKQRIYELVRTNKIPVIRLGNRQYRFLPSEIVLYAKKGGNTKEGKDETK